MDNSVESLKFIFVSIPKNASKSVYQALGYKNKDRSKKTDIGILDNHCRCEVLINRYSIDEFNSRFKFCIVRNPWERAVSWFYYHKNVIRSPVYNTTFEQWVLNNCPHHWKKQNGTDYLQLGLSPLEQWHWIYDQHDNIMVDFVAKYETLNEDFSKVLHKLYPLNPTIADEICLKIVNSYSRNRKIDYMNEYDEITFNIVKELCKKDIKLFDYGREFKLCKD